MGRMQQNIKPKLYEIKLSYSSVMFIASMYCITNIRYFYL